MTEVLKVDYDGILSTKTALESQQTEFDDLYQRMSTTVNSLPNYWSGASAVSYVQQFEDLSSSFDSISTLIGNLALQLNSITENFADADAGMSDQIGVC